MKSLQQKRKLAWRIALVNIDHHPAVVVNFDTIAILLKVTDVGDSEAPHQNEITASLAKQLFREHFDLFVDTIKC